jgi:probable rRNA maturation factor
MSSECWVEVQIADGAPPDLTPALLHRLACFTVQWMGVDSPLTVSLVVTDDATIQRLHAHHMGINEPTDVLTFALDDGDDFVSAEAGGEPPLLGEVVVSFERAAEQAAAYHQTVTREVCFLVVHGLLHLLGYDDATDEQRATMLAQQEVILNAFEQ